MRAGERIGSYTLIELMGSGFWLGVLSICILGFTCYLWSNRTMVPIDES